MTANLSYPIGSFNLTRELACNQASVTSLDEQLEEQSRPGSAASLARSVESYGQEQKKAQQGQKLAEVDDPNAAIYERMIIMLPYKAAQPVTGI